MQQTDINCLLSVTMICQDNEVQTAVEADLLEAVHELTDDLIHSLKSFNQLHETDETN